MFKPPTGNSIEPILEPAAFMEYLCDKTKFVDIDMAVGQTNLLLEHLENLKSKRTLKEANGEVQQRCSMECNKENIEGNEVGQLFDVAREKGGQSAALFKNSLASEGMELRLRFKNCVKCWPTGTTQQ